MVSATFLVYWESCSCCVGGCNTRKRHQLRNIFSEWRKTGQQTIQDCARKTQITWFLSCVMWTYNSWMPSLIGRPWSIVICNISSVKTRTTRSNVKSSKSLHLYFPEFLHWRLWLLGPLTDTEYGFLTGARQRVDDVRTASSISSEWFLSDVFCKWL